MNSIHSSKGSKSLGEWNEDSAIVFDPAQQKFFKDSVSRITNGEFALHLFRRNKSDRIEEQNYEKYTTITLPRLSNSVECYIEGRSLGENHREKVTLGTVNLKKLPWLLNAKRRFGKIKELYVLGKFEPPQ